MKPLHYVFMFLLLGNLQAKSQTLPVMTDTAIHISELLDIKPYAVRIAKNPVNNSLYYATFDGNIYRIKKTGSFYSDTLIATAANHNINYLQSIIFNDSNIYLIGNRKFTGIPGYGLIMRGKYQASGNWIWDTLMHTASYPSTATLYDHAFSSICLSANKDTLYFSSGSRTDHGEVQTSAGLFPNKREVGLTTTIFKIPVNPPGTIYLPNDSAALISSGYVYCRGVRNSFDLELAPNGDLFGCENSGDRDDPDELNWLRPGYHYGFPWNMGGNETPMQFQGYNPANDKLINHQCAAWKKTYFYNDVNYPQPPPGTIFTEPVRNYGPDADKFRDALTGSVRDASSEGGYITSFTSHRSPLGLVFDRAGKSAPPYYKSAFMFSYTEGTADSSGNVGNNIGPFCDTGQDLLQLCLFKDTLTGIYSMNCYRLGSTFINPVDAYIDNNIIYAIETHINDSIPHAKLYAITLPPNPINGSAQFLGKDTTICSGNTITLLPNLKGKFNYEWSNGSTNSQLLVNPGSTTSYWLKVNNGMISFSDTITVTVKNTPSPASSITVTGGSAAVCPGETRIYSTPFTAGITYNWTLPVGSHFINGQNTNTINVQYDAAFTGPGTLSVIKSKNGCSSAPKNSSVLRNDPPSSITTLGPTTFCSGTTPLTLTANSNINFTYKWKKGSNFISGATGISYLPSASGTYRVEVTNNLGCNKLSSGIAVTVNTLPAASITPLGPLTFCVGDSVILQANSGIDLTYQWKKGTNLISTATQSLYTAKTAGTYKVIVTNNNGCSKTSAGKTVSITCRTIAENLSSNPFTIYPNPADDYITIKYEATKNENYSLKIYDLSGRLLMENTGKFLAGTNEIPIDVSELSSGIYMLKVCCGPNVSLTRLVIH